MRKLISKNQCLKRMYPINDETSRRMSSGKWVTLSNFLFNTSELASSFSSLDKFNASNYSANTLYQRPDHSTDGAMQYNTVFKEGLTTLALEPSTTEGTRNTKRIGWTVTNDLSGAKKARLTLFTNAACQESLGVTSGNLLTCVLGYISGYTEAIRLQLGLIDSDGNINYDNIEVDVRPSGASSWTKTIYPMPAVNPKWPLWIVAEFDYDNELFTLSIGSKDAAQEPVLVTSQTVTGLFPTNYWTTFSGNNATVQTHTVDYYLQEIKVEKYE